MKITERDLAIIFSVCFLSMGIIFITISVFFPNGTDKINQMQSQGNNFIQIGISLGFGVEKLKRNNINELEEKIEKNDG